MKYRFDIGSASAGALVSSLALLALTSPVLSAIDSFGHTDATLPWVVGGLAALAGSAALASVTPGYLRKPGDGTVSRIVAGRHPAAVTGTFTAPALDPVSWIEATRQATRPGVAFSDEADLRSCIETGLLRQVYHDVDPALGTALGVAFDACLQRDGDLRYLDLLTRMMLDSLDGKVAFELQAYLAECRSMGYDSAHHRRIPFSAFPVVDLLRLFVVCRESFPIASAEFVWLKRKDRVLWYTLNNVGRKTFHVEALGIMAHYYSQGRSPEKVLLDKPDVSDGVAGVIAYLDEQFIDLVGTEG